MQNVDVLVGSDAFNTSLQKGDEGLEVKEAIHGDLSLGKILFTPIPSTQSLWSYSRQVLKRLGTEQDYVPARFL